MVLVHAARALEFDVPIVLQFQCDVQLRLRVDDLRSQQQFDHTVFRYGEGIRSARSVIGPCHCKLTVQMRHDDLVGTDSAVLVVRVDLEGVVSQRAVAIVKKCCEVRGHIQMVQHIFGDGIDHHPIERRHVIGHGSSPDHVVEDLHIGITLVHVQEVVLLGVDHTESVQKQRILVRIPVEDKKTICKRDDTRDVLIHRGAFLHELEVDLGFLQSAEQSTRICSTHDNNQRNLLIHDVHPAVHEARTCRSFHQFFLQFRYELQNHLDHEVRQFTIGFPGIVVDLVGRTRQPVLHGTASTFADGKRDQGLIFNGTELPITVYRSDLGRFLPHVEHDRREFRVKGKGNGIPSSTDLNPNELTGELIVFDRSQKRLVQCSTIAFSNNDLFVSTGIQNLLQPVDTGRQRSTITVDEQLVVVGHKLAPVRLHFRNGEGKLLMGDVQLLTIQEQVLVFVHLRKTEREAVTFPVLVFICDRIAKNTIDAGGDILNIDVLGQIQCRFHVREMKQDTQQILLVQFRVVGFFEPVPFEFFQSRVDRIRFHFRGSDRYVFLLFHKRLHVGITELELFVLGLQQLIAFLGCHRPAAHLCGKKNICFLCRDRHLLDFLFQLLGSNRRCIGCDGHASGLGDCRRFGDSTKILADDLLLDFFLLGVVDFIGIGFDCFQGHLGCNVLFCLLFRHGHLGYTAGFVLFVCFLVNGNV